VRPTANLPVERDFDLKAPGRAGKLTTGITLLLTVASVAALAQLSVA